MWDLYLLAKTTNSRPSDLVCIEDRWAAYQFDSAVTFVGLTIESALHETREVGVGQSKRVEPKYTIAQLLEPEFRLPRPGGPPEGIDADSAYRAMAGRGVRVFKAKRG